MQAIQAIVSTSSQPLPASFRSRQGHDRAREPGCPPGAGLALAVRRAEALIVSHPDATYTAEGLARAVGVSARSLSRGFQRLRGCSPMAAVRRARLARVRLDLLNAAPEESVTDAAMRWGFYHLGRFSGLYASHFGELPSATRRRSRPAQASTAI
jgi:transcriptional regulator GlxA family with amidase domain